MYTILYISMCIIYQYIYLYILYIYYDMQYYNSVIIITLHSILYNTI